MIVTFVQSLPFTVCKHPFLSSLKDKNSLPQCQQLNNFIETNQITDLVFDDDGRPHCMIGLIVNNGYCSLDSLKTDIVNAGARAEKYLYIAVNKFLVYSQNNLAVTDTDYDVRLVEYCGDLIADNFSLIDYTTRSDDQGLLGNFVHPVTTMFFKRYD